ncbi:MAG: response regulator, partial [Fimbriimonadaceae bacterium]
MTRVVVIEDETAIRRFLKAGFGDSEAEWFEAETGREGIKLVAQKNPDVVLLDLGLPDMDGLAVLAQLREWSQVPIIILSARGQERDKIAALDGGADDYLTKPFSIGELMARVRVARRHAGKESTDAPVFDAEGLRIDFASRTVMLDGVEVRLTQIEFKLLS